MKPVGFRSFLAVPDDRLSSPGNIRYNPGLRPLLPFFSLGH